jgi:hypothetical protein
MEIANARSLRKLFPSTWLTGCQRRYTIDIGILATSRDATAAPGQTGLLSLALALEGLIGGCLDNMKISEYVVCAGWHVFFLENDHVWVAFVFVLDPATKYLVTAIAIVRGKRPSVHTFDSDVLPTDIPRTLTSVIPYHLLVFQISLVLFQRPRFLLPPPLSSSRSEPAAMIEALPKSPSLSRLRSWPTYHG